MTTLNLPFIIQQSMNRLPLDQSTFYQIARIFNINAQNVNDINSRAIMEEKLKNKILDIFHTEGQNIKDYLKLPKFNLLKPQSLEKLVNLFNDIWTNYYADINNQRKNKQIKQLTDLIPKFNSIDQIEAFHLELLNQFKQSKLCPLNKPQRKSTNPQNQFFPRPFQYNREDDSAPYKKAKNQTFPTPNAPQDNPFSTYNNKNITKIQDDQQNNQIWNNQNKYGMHSNSSFPIPGLPPQYQYLSKRQNLTPNHAIPNIHQMHNPMNFNQYTPEIQHQTKYQICYFTGQQNQLQNKMEKYMFLQCPCQGKYKSNISYLTCNHCNFSFHYKCLLSDASQSVISQCPQCKLKKGSNIFMKIYDKAFGKRWFSKKSGVPRLQFMLSQKEIDDLKAIKSACKPTSTIQYQLRFQKIIPRNLINQSNIRDKNRKFNNLNLPQQFIQAVKPNNQFQINIKFPQKSEEEDNLFFFAIFVVQKYSDQSIINDLFLNLNESNSSGQERLNQFLQGKPYIDLNMKDSRVNRLIKYPVRGQFCQHAQVFDYETLLDTGKTYGQKFKQFYCPQCDSTFINVKADRFLYQKIKQMGQGYTYENHHTLRYSGDGRIEWNPRIQQSMSQQQNEQEQDDQVDSEQQKSSSPLSS